MSHYIILYKTLFNYLLTVISYLLDAFHTYHIFSNIVSHYMRYNIRIYYYSNIVCNTLHNYVLQVSNLIDYTDIPRLQFNKATCAIWQQFDDGTKTLIITANYYYCQ